MTGHTPPKRHASVVDLIAGSVCLDFVNTLDDRPAEKQTELLNDYNDLARFAEQSGILTPAQTDALLDQAARSPDEAKSAFLRARRLREALFEIFSAFINHKTTPSNAMEILNRNLHDSALHSHLKQAKESYEWRFDDLTSSFGGILWPITRAAAALLTSADVGLVRTCSSPTCQWFFLDTSKNHRRRWCDMTKCGNRAKVRNFYARKKQGSEKA
jgi:predicted RNA-binding Zn ribbon-like protein